MTTLKNNLHLIDIPNFQVSFKFWMIAIKWCGCNRCIDSSKIRQVEQLLTKPVYSIDIQF